MFPGCTPTDMRIRQQDLLRENGYEPTQRWANGQWVADYRLWLDRLFVGMIVSLLALLGL